MGAVVLSNQTWRLDETGQSASIFCHVLTDETLVKQRGMIFPLFAAINPESKDLLYTAVIAWQILSQRGSLESLGVDRENSSGRDRWGKIRVISLST